MGRGSIAVGGTRRTAVETVTIALGAAVSGVIDAQRYGAGIVIMPAAWTTADLGIQVCDTETGTFVPLLDLENGYGTDVSINGAAAGKAYPLPPYVFAAPYFKLWSHNGSGTNTNQEAARTLTVLLKA